MAHITVQTLNESENFILFYFASKKVYMAKSSKFENLLFNIFGGSGSDSFSDKSVSFMTHGVKYENR